MAPVTRGAQGLQPLQAPWRGAGQTPCVGSDGGLYKCPPAPRVVAVRAGRLFDSQAGVMLTKQVVLVKGDRIAAVGPEARVKIPDGAQVVDLSRATLLPGLIDAHTHMFNTRDAKTTTEAAILGCRFKSCSVHVGPVAQPGRGLRLRNGVLQVRILPGPLRKESLLR